MKKYLKMLALVVLVVPIAFVMTACSSTNLNAPTPVGEAVTVADVTDFLETANIDAWENGMRGTGEMAFHENGKRQGSGSMSFRANEDEMFMTMNISGDGASIRMMMYTDGQYDYMHMRMGKESMSFKSPASDSFGDEFFSLELAFAVLEGDMDLLQGNDVEIFKGPRGNNTLVTIVTENTGAYYGGQMTTATTMVLTFNASGALTKIEIWMTAETQVGNNTSTEKIFMSFTPSNVGSISLPKEFNDKDTWGTGFGF